jgi:hypothetical protein
MIGQSVVGACLLELEHYQNKEIMNYDWAIGGRKI